jgi:hypothetical protein
MQALDIAGTLLSSGAFLGRDVTVRLQRLDSSGQRNIGVRTGTFRWPIDCGTRFERASEIRQTALSRCNAAEADRYVESKSNVGRVSLVVT